MAEVKPAAQMVEQVEEFLPRAREALEQFAELGERLKDPDFARLWESDSAEALRQVGIDPEARKEMGLGPYDEGAQCNWCVTPMGKACHC